MDVRADPLPPARIAPHVAESVRAALRAAAAAEPCGYLLGRRTVDRCEVVEAVAGRNAHPTPLAGFRLTAAEQLAVRRQARARGLRVLGTWHAHLLGPPILGRADREALKAPGLGLMLIAGRTGRGDAAVRAYAATGRGVLAWSVA